MKKTKNIQEQFHAALKDTEHLLLNLEKSCSPFHNEEMQNALNNMNDDLQIIKRAQFDDYEYAKINDFLKQIVKIKHLAHHDHDIQTLTDHMTDHLMSFRKKFYFAPHLCAALEAVPGQQNAIRHLILQLAALRHTYESNLDKCIERQKKAVIDTYNQEIKLSTPEPVPVKPLFFKLRASNLKEVLKHFMKTEMDVELEKNFEILPTQKNKR